MTAIQLMRPQLPTATELSPFLREIDRNRFYTNFGPLVRRFEAVMAERCGLTPEQVTTVSNATLGLTLALEATGAEPGSLCILPSYTFSATASAVVRAGFIPYFVDIDPESLALSPSIALAALRTAPGEVGAVLPVSPFGCPIDAQTWAAFQADTGLPVVVDAAAAFDSFEAGPVATVVSLHATKAFGIGEGALVLSADSAFITRVRQRTSFGFPFVPTVGVRSREAQVAGTNAKVTEYTAAIGLAMWERWPEHRARLAAVRNRYLRAIPELPGVSAQPGDDGSWVSATFNLMVAPDLLDDLMDSFESAGVPTRLWWGRGCAPSTAYQGYPATELPVTEDLAPRVIGVPSYSDIPKEDQDVVMSSISDAISSRGKRG